MHITKEGTHSHVIHHKLLDFDSLMFSLTQHDINTSTAALLRIIHELGELADIYLVFHAPSDEHEKEIQTELQLCLAGFPMHRCLFHSTELGKVAIVRQVIPSLLIEYDRSFCDKLKPHLKRIIWVDSIAVGCANTTTQACNPDLQGATTTTSDKCGAVQGTTSSQGSQASVGFPTVSCLVDVLHISLTL